MSTFDLNFWKELDSSLSGWMSEAEARFLVKNVVGDTYWEIGVAYGKSFKTVMHHFPDIQVTGVDLIDHGVGKGLNELKYTVILGDANTIHKPSDGWISTLFIDGDHTYKGCLSDFVHWYNKVKPGGRIIFHDYQRDKNHEGVTQAVDAIKPLLKDFKFIKSIACGTK